MSKKQGYISLYRSIQEHWLWKSKPFSRGQAFIDLVLSANHADDKVAVGNEIIEVKRGSFITSQKKLAGQWGWSRTKVKSFLDLLESDNMIEQKSDTKKTYLTISNYAVFQDLGNSKKTSKEHQKNIKKTSNEHQKNTNNNDNNVNNENNGNNIPPLPPSQSPAKTKYAEFVAMTNDEYQLLLAKFGKADTDRLIEILDNYKGSTGKKYKSDYRAILSWCVKRLEEEKQHKPQQSTGNPFLDLLKSGKLDDAEGSDIF